MPYPVADAADYVLPELLPDAKPGRFAALVTKANRYRDSCRGVLVGDSRLETLAGATFAKEPPEDCWPVPIMLKPRPQTHKFGVEAILSSRKCYKVIDSTGLVV